jgi:hypothetical protein
MECLALPDSLVGTANDPGLKGCDRRAGLRRYMRRLASGGIELLDRSAKAPGVLPGDIDTNERHLKELLQQHHNQPVKCNC